MAKSEFNGNPIYSNDEYLWRYCLDDKPVNFHHPRKCPHCSKKATKEGHDACLGTLPNVKYACCGHYSKNGHPYAVIENEGIETVLNFPDAESMYKYFEINGYKKDIK